MGYFLALSVGLVLGFVSRHRWSYPAWTRALNILLWAALAAALAGMAARLGADPTVLDQGVVLGLQAVALAGATVAGSVTLMTLFRRWLP